MSRKARISVPGCLHHIMSRGIEGREIFGDDDDRYRFCQLLARYLKYAMIFCSAGSVRVCGKPVPETPGIFGAESRDYD